MLRIKNGGLQKLHVYDRLGGISWRKDDLASPASKSLVLKTIVLSLPFLIVLKKIIKLEIVMKNYLSCWSDVNHVVIQ